MSETGIQSGKIAAVFDIDGTLLPAPSLEWRLLAHMALNGEMHLGAVGRWVRTLISQLLPISRDERKTPVRSLAVDENKSYWAGARIGAVDAWIARRFADLEFFSEALAMVEWHHRRGHTIVLISGTLAPLARAVGSLLARDGEKIHLCATELECDSGQWTGRVAGEVICGPAKERALVRLAAEHHFDLGRSYAYADSLKDRWLLGAVGRAIVVNPAPRLAQLARRSGWRLVNWNDRACVSVDGGRAPFSGAEKDAQVFAEKFSWQ